MKPKYQVADQLSRYQGQWVAVKDGTIIDSSHDAGELIAKLRREQIDGAVLRRIPDDLKATYIL
jgi:hypothetical protein